MEATQDTTLILEQLARTAIEQNRTLKKQMLVAWISLGLSFALTVFCFAALLPALPRLNRALETLQTAGEKMNALSDGLSEIVSVLEEEDLNNTIDKLNRAAEALAAADWEGSMDSLKAALEDISSLDLAGMLTEVKAFIEEGQGSVAGAAEKLDTIDIDGLNQSIADLQKIVGTLAKLFGR